MARAFDLVLLFMITRPLRLFIIFLFVLGATSSCQYIPFFGNDSTEHKVTEESLAYFVPDQKVDYVNKKMIKVKGDMNVIVNLLSELLKNQTGMPTSVIRNSSNETGFGGKRDLMRVVTSEVPVDSIAQFKEHFLTGYYLLEDPKYIIKPENMSYAMEAQISIMGQDFFVEFKVTGKTDWSVYEILKNQKLKKLPNSFKPKIGVGTFRTKREIKKKSRIGNELTEYEYYTVTVKDQPISKGTTEDLLYNMAMEQFAINNIYAQSLFQ